MYKKLIYSLAIVAVVAIAFLFNSCSDSLVVSPGKNQVTTDAGNGCDTVPNQFCGLPGTAFVQNPCPGTVTTIDLWAGVGNVNAGVLVGHVDFSLVSGNTYKVTYVFTDPTFTPSVVHFAISCTLAGIPQSRTHNPIPGQFQYSTSSAPWELTFTLPTGCSCFYVAAHAGGTFTGVANFNLIIPPGCVNLHVEGGWSSALPDTGCYWNFTLSNAGAFNGNYCGYCIDLGHDMTPPGARDFTCARIYSSYEPLPACDIGFPYIEHPENFPKVNYLINHFQAGQTVNLTNSDCSLASGTGVLTVIDIQKAIWSLLDEGPGNDYNEFSDPLRVNAILCDVNANGAGFVPDCQNGDKIVFVVIPDGQNCPYTVQPIIGFKPCSVTSGSATAWGDGKYGANFLGSNWATFFKWCPTCP